MVEPSPCHSPDDFSTDNLAKIAFVSTGGVRTVTWTAAYAASPNRLLRLSIVS